MFNKTKFALAAVMVLSATLTASAATKVRVVHDDQAAASDAIPGYAGDGHTVAIPNPDRQR